MVAHSFLFFLSLPMLSSVARRLTPAPEPLAETSPRKVVCWDHIYMIYAALRIKTTLSSLERFIKPFHTKLVASIAHSQFPAYSPGGKIPDIFSQAKPEQENGGPLGSYVRLYDILLIAQQIDLVSTTVSSHSYQGGDMYTPLLTSLKDAHDYTGSVDQNLLLFNLSPLWDEEGKETNSGDLGPKKPGFWSPP